MAALLAVELIRDLTVGGISPGSPVIINLRWLASAFVLLTVLATTSATPTAAPATTGGVECLNWRPALNEFPVIDYGGDGTTDDTIDRDIEVGGLRLDWFIRTDGLIDASIAVPAAAILGNDQARSWKTSGDLRPGAQVRLYGGPRHARSFRLNPDGSFEYRPAAGYFGEDSFVYYYYLGNYCSRPTAVKIKETYIAVVRPDAYDVDAVPPPDATVVTPDQGVVVLPPLGTWITNQPFDLKENCVSPDRGQVEQRCGVLLNDENVPDTRPPFPRIRWTPPPNFTGTVRTAHGVAVPRTDGSFAYTPDTGFEGQDSLTYTVDSAGPQSIRTATVTLNVRRRPIARVYATDDQLLTGQDVALPIASALLLSNDFGVQDIRTVSGDTNFAGADPTFGRPSSRRTSHGTLAIGWLQLDPILGPFWVGSVTYTPDPEYFGPDEFYYEARGTGATAWGRVSINVTNKPDSPVARHDFVRVQPGSVTAIDVLANDTDADGDIAGVELPVPSPLWSQAGLQIVFTAPFGFYGTPFTTYHIYDATGLSSDAVIFARVTPLVPDGYSMDEDTTLTVGGTGVRTNDTACNVDLCDASVSVEVVDQPLHGSVDLAPSGAFTYTPSTNFTGIDTFTYRARGGDPEYVLDLDVIGVEKAVVTITVADMPEAPSVVLNEACPQDVPSDSCADDQDARVVQEGGAVRLRGYVTEPDPGFSGSLFVHWGDGTSTEIVPYPCLPGQLGAAGCQRTVWFTATWSGATQSADRMYFDLSHVYSGDPPGAPDVYRITVGAGDSTGRANPTGAEAAATVFEGPPTPTPLHSPAPTATATASAACIGDCDGGGSVTVDEIITLVSIALGSSAASSCPRGIASGEAVDVALIIAAVNNALAMCAP